MLHKIQLCLEKLLYVVLWLPLLHSFIQQSLNKVRFWAGWNPALEVCDSENLHYWFQLEIRAITFLLVNHFAKQFIITNHTHIHRPGFRHLFQRIFMFHRPFSLIFIFIFPVKEQSFSNQYLKYIIEREYFTKKVGFFFSLSITCQILFYRFSYRFCQKQEVLQILWSNYISTLKFFLKTPS